MNLIVDRTRAQQYEDVDTKERYFSVSEGLACLDPTAFAWVKPGVLEAASKQGAELHLLFALLMCSRMGICKPPTPADHLTGYFKAMVTWAEINQVAPIRVEEKAVNRKYHYAGTPDLFCEMGPSRAPTLVDLKSGVPTRLHAVQLEAYSRMDNVPNAHRLVTLYISENGTYKAPVVAPTPQDWASFLAALGVLRWRQNGK